MTHPKKLKRWFIYVLKCSDGSLYTGSTNDINARFAKHSAGKGAKYTRARRPLKLLYSRRFNTKSEALKAEYRMKQLSRSEKLSLILDQVK